MMMGPALFELYSSGYSSANARGRRSSGSNGDITDRSKFNKEMSLKSSSSGALAQKLNESNESKCSPDSPKLKRSASSQRCYRVKYIGSSFLDKSHTLPMLPWIVADIKRQANSGHGNKYAATNVILEVTENSVKVVTQNDKHVLLVHPLPNISKFTQTSQDRTWFSYLYRENADSPFTIHTFQAQDENSVLDLFTTMRELTKEVMHNQPGQGLQRTRSGSGLETILTNSHQYEVMYIGSIRMSQKRAHPKVIDDAVEKFLEMEKQKSEEKEDNGSDMKSRHSSGSSVNSLPNIPDSNEQMESEGESKNIIHDSTLDYGKDAKYIEIRVSPKRRFLVQPVIEEGNERTSPSLSPSSNLRLPTTLIPNTQSLDAVSRSVLLKELHDFQQRKPSSSTSCSFDSPDHSASARKRSMSGDEVPHKQQSLPFGRTRLGSGGSLDFGRRRNIRYQNKTLLFLIGRLELCLISTDKHKVVLSKTFSNISHCSQGVTNPDHFGLICREPAVNTGESYVIHVFKCQTEKLVSEIMHALKQAFSNAYQATKNRPTLICESCPMNLFHHICRDVEGLSDDKAHAVIVNRIDSLSGRDRDEIMTKCQGAKINSMHEQNELYMIFMKELCETKQKKHLHGNFEKGTLEKRMDIIKEKAKSSISNTFEQFFKPLFYNEKTPSVRKRSATVGSCNTLRSVTSKLSRTESSESVTSLHSPNTTQSTDDSIFEETSQRPRSNTLSEIKELKKDPNPKCPRSESLAVHHHQPPNKSRLKIFMKVGSQTKLPTNDDFPQSNDRQSKNGGNSSSGSWRQSIFNSITLKSNNSNGNGNGNKLKGRDLNGEAINKSFEMSDLPKKRTREELKGLWKSAIKQQIMLNKMEKENKKLQANQSVASDKRMKLDYDEIPNFSDATKLWDATKSWDHLLMNDQRPNYQLNENEVKHAISLGVPRHKRGEIWLFLAEQSLLSSPSCVNLPQDMDTPYRELLGQLTTQQHAILVDLGRTFPKVPFYAQALGPGQLSLFNLLKAYSLLDMEVEYCQGLSFVAGVLLLHMSEDDSFQMMKHLLFHRGLRKQYKPDMDALQMQLYQLTRLLYDRHHSLYEHFEHHDIAPTLYAAPWFLTLFASQFPLSFVARLFDIIFLCGIEAIFRVALALLMAHSDALLQCHSFESIMDFLKSVLPAVDTTQMEQVFNQVLAMDIKKQLDAYEVEYRVIQEEMHYASLAGTSTLGIKGGKHHTPNIQSQSERELHLEVENKEFRNENMELTEQMHVHQSTIHQLQSSCDNYLSTIKRMETRVRALEDERDALMHSVKSLQRRNEKLETASASSAGASTDGNKIDEGHGKSGGERNSIGHTPIFNISCEADDDDDDQECDLEDDEDEDIDFDDDDDDGHHKHDSDCDNNCHNRTQSDASVLSI